MDTIEIWESEIANERYRYFEDLESKTSLLIESFNLDIQYVDMFGISEGVFSTIKEKFLAALRAIKTFITTIIGKIAKLSEKFKKKDAEIKKKLEEKKEESNSSDVSEEEKEAKIKKELEELVKENSPVYDCSATDWKTLFIRSDLLFIKKAIHDYKNRRWLNEDIENIIEKYNKSDEDIIKEIFSSEKLFDDKLKDIKNALDLSASSIKCTLTLNSVTDILKSVESTTKDIIEIVDKQDFDKYDQEDFDVFKKSIMILNKMKHTITIIIKEMTKTKSVLGKYFEICNQE